MTRTVGRARQIHKHLPTRGNSLPAWIAAAASITAAIITIAAQGSYEHSQWTRDKQEAAYYEYSSAAQSLYLSLQSCPMIGDEINKRRVALGDAMLGIEIYGSDRTINAAKKMLRNFHPEEDCEDGRKSRALTRSADKYMGELVESMRADLRLEE